MNEQKYILFTPSPMVSFVAKVKEYDENVNVVKIKDPISFFPDTQSGRLSSGYGLSPLQMVEPEISETLNLSSVISYTFVVPEKIIEEYEHALSQFKAKMAGIEIPNQVLNETSPPPKRGKIIDL